MRLFNRYFQLFLFIFLVFSIFIVACNDTADSPDETVNPTRETSDLSDLAVPSGEQAAIPAWEAYQEQITAALNNDFIPILLMGEELAGENNALLAQSTAAFNAQFMQFARNGETGEAYRNEMMSVRPLLPSDYTERTQSCSSVTCYRVEMYNFFFNITSIAVVDTNNKAVLDVNHYNDAKPDLNQRLTDLALEIANNSPQVKAALGDRLGTTEPIEPTMGQIKTALNGSRCERSRHLCVAPTYVVGNEALWAIVDLTDGRIAGIRWTDLGESGPANPITQQMIENEYVMLKYCEQTNELTLGDWTMEYIITNSDGMLLTDVQYQGQPVMRSAKLVDWHVSYSTREGFGYSDAIGCPMFSSAVVVAYNDPFIEEIEVDGVVVGQAFIQDFRQLPWPTPCNYRYTQRFEFYNDGRFRIAAGDYGRGCGNDATYRPVMRIDLATEQETFAEWNGSAWQTWEQEQWQLQTDGTPYTPEGYQYRITANDGIGYYIEPGSGQFQHGKEGDNAYTYISVRHPDRDEGDSDMITLGSCCNTDHQQGPEQFQEPPEDTAGTDLVLWYVPQLQNDDTPGAEWCWANTVVENGSSRIAVWPCYTGPMFVPIP